MSYQVESSDVTHNGVMATVRVDRLRTPDGDVVQREVVEHSGAVAIVAVDDDGQVVLVRQYRHAVGDRVLELPAGKLDVEGELHEAAARRELLEEVGLEAVELVELTRFYNSAGWTDEQTTVFVALGLREGSVPADFTPKAEEADMDVVRMPLEEAVALAEAGELRDAKTLIGLLMAGSTLRQSSRTKALR
ncbi:MAG: NUDIX hydrolase [Actinomycetota bacterium]|jgi:ADP-ribose pyrophosphatase|nr:NUDIX hydrolase [Actinomycetota bacterium]